MSADITNPKPSPLGLQATVTIIAVTVAGNNAPTGGNITAYGTVMVKNTILIKGTNGVNCSGTLAAGSTTNLADDSTCGVNATVKPAAEINLGALASNGRLTQPMALQSGSAAIDAGNANACKTSKAERTD